jgi:hypothetical protein
MNRRVLLVVAGLMIVLMPATALQAQTKAPAAKAYTGPKTPWGDPDLQGTWTSDDCIGTPMQRPAEAGEKLYLTDAELTEREATIARQAANDKQEFVASNARAVVNPPGHWGERARRPCRQTSLVIDPANGRTPDLIPEAQSALAARPARNAVQPASPEDFSFYIRCITRGVAGSILPVIYGNGTRILQAPGQVLLLQEMVHEARVIPLNGGPHPGPNFRSYMGDSRGHWEGNTLVVETTNFLSGRTGIGGNGGGTPTSEALKLTEKFTRVDPNTINYEMTVDDPKTYARPWKVGFPITQEPGYELFEYACHEGNNAMFNSLSGARAQEKATEKQ